MKNKLNLSDLKQSKYMTLIEQVANVGSGMVIAFGISQITAHYEWLIQDYIWHGFHWSVSAGSNLVMTIILTIVSVTRGYFWRRAFNHHHANKLLNKIEGDK